jgi:multiple sugar transport system permease protein
MAISLASRSRNLATNAGTPPGGSFGSRRTLRKQIWDARWCYLFMLPSLVLAAMFTFYPLVASWYFSFLNWSGFTSDREWVGLANYREVIRDEFFWDSYRRTFLFMLGSVPLRLILSLVIAMILNDAALRMGSVLRTMFFIPVVTTAAIVGIVMTFVFSPFNGPVNEILMSIGLIDRPVDFLGDPDSAMWTVVGVHIWKNFGITMIYWLAALQVVPQDLYEAARIDGAGTWRLFRDITMPLLLPFAAIIALITIVQTLQVFPIVQTMTGGGPFFASEVMEVYIYRNAFGEGGIPRLGFASAAGVFFGMTVMVIAILQGLGLRKAQRARRDYVGGAS